MDFQRTLSVAPCGREGRSTFPGPDFNALPLASPRPHSFILTGDAKRNLNFLSKLPIEVLFLSRTWKVQS